MKIDKIEVGMVLIYNELGLKEMVFDHRIKAKDVWYVVSIDLMNHQATLKNVRDGAKLVVNELGASYMKEILKEHPRW